jgi:GNAT superfamily N-acetyltransferase
VTQVGASARPSASAVGDDGVVTDTGLRVRPAGSGDAPRVADLAGSLAQSFAFDRREFDVSFAAVLASADACLLVAVEGETCIGYLLGGTHPTFYAGGVVAVVEEILVRLEDRRRGVGRLLMSGLERWAGERRCTLVSLATRRAAAFYLALGYEESATYYRKILGRTELVRADPAAP